MRLSACSSSEFFTADAIKSSTYVTLNGERLEHVREAFEEEGWADVVAYENGQPKIVDNRFVLERRHGVVVIHIEGRA